MSSTTIDRRRTLVPLSTAFPSTACPSIVCPSNTAPDPVLDWDQLVHRYSPFLFRYLRRRVRRVAAPFDSDAPAEALQILWCQVFERGGDYLPLVVQRGEGAIRGYLARMAVWVVSDMGRRILARKRGSHVLSAAPSVVIDMRQRNRDPYWNPERGCLVREARRAFLDECSRIATRRNRATHRERNVRILRRALLEGWSSREIERGERQLGGRIAASSIDTLVSRARRSFAATGWRFPGRRRDFCSRRMARAGTGAGRRCRRA